MYVSLQKKIHTHHYYALNKFIIHIQEHTYVHM